jgi:predicted small integral membrane protein
VDHIHRCVIRCGKQDLERIPQECADTTSPGAHQFVILVKLRAIVLLSGFMFSARKLEKEPFRLCGFVADTLATRHGRMMVVRRYISIVPKWLELWRSRYWSCSVGLYGG